LVYRSLQRDGDSTQAVRVLRRGEEVSEQFANCLAFYLLILIVEISGEKVTVVLIKPGSFLIRTSTQDKEERETQALFNDF
jgi:hypothetical protein